MAERDKRRRRILEQVASAARELAQQRDGTRLAPPEIQGQVAEWRQRLGRHDRELDEEGWLIGLLTLACLAQGEPGPEGAAG